MMFIEASCPSNKEAAVTIRTLYFGLYGGICFIDKKSNYKRHKFTEYSKKYSIYTKISNTKIESRYIIINSI
ncbi:hypothetical protein GCM10009431_13930 [Gaetbulibacter jejuensis]|uniref:Uncharacterized protein n=1 Tax=Gaetbulibacter jejuensis TaxID=584607 RepID=A0ABN1JLA5_9FLAO